MKDRFTIEYDSKGCQLHNEYIDKIAQGIITYNKARGIKTECPEQVYGMICFDRNILEIWEEILDKASLL